MHSRTKTEDMPALQVAGAGTPLLEESARYLRRRHEHPEQGDFTDDEPTRPMGRPVAQKEE